LDPIVWIVVAVVVLAIVAFVALRKKPPEIEGRDEPRLRPADKARPEAKKPEKREAAAPEKREAKKAPAAPVEEEEVPTDHEDEREREEEDERDEAKGQKPPPAPIARRKRDVAGLRKGLTKTREPTGIFGRLRELLGGKKEIDPAITEQIEEILLTSDVGVKTTAALLEDIRGGLERNELDDTGKVWAALRRRAAELCDVSGGGPIRNHGKPTVVLMVGVNGSGKTTTIGKLATKFVEGGKKVMIVAGDTFRAAAVDQLKVWGERVGCDVFSGKEGADPAAVVFDAVKQAQGEGHDLVLVDTAGRLHTKSNLMDELKKVARTAGKALEGAPHETLLVVDGTNGQNALQQAKEFGEALTLTGIMMTKLDGTARGGIVLAIAQEHGIPVRYIGVGERPQDLRDFDAEEFVEAMLGDAGDAAQAA
jgi:fused signal recognition particle receptor